VLAVVPKALGPRLGKDVQRVIRAVKDGDWSAVDGQVVAGGVELAEGEYTLRLVPADPDRSAPLPGDVGVVVLDTAVTPELEAEGVARDVVRAVQQARKDAGLDVADRIRLTVEASESVATAIQAHQQFLASETLAAEVVFGAVEADATEVGDGGVVRVAVEKV
jgi:isoleucyl-tRNA synthetase